MMQQKTFYLPGYNALVFCHDDNEKELILGGLNKFFEDTYTDNSRQSIGKDDFLKLEPVEINPEFIDDYDFLHKVADSENYEVKDYKVKFYIDEACALPAAPFKKAISASPGPESTIPKTGQGRLF